MAEPDRRPVPVLSEDERTAWEAIVRRQEAHAERLPAVVIGGGWSAVMLVLFGVPTAGVAVAAATALIWLVWRLLPSRLPSGPSHDR